MIFTVTVIVIFSLLEHMFALPCIGPQGSTCDCSGTKVNCNFKSLTAIPDDVPLNTTSLNLSTNKISTIAANAFDDLVSLDTLFLSRNNISSLPNGLFSKNINLRKVNLEKNRLSSLPVDIFSSNIKLVDVDLEDNNFSSLPVGVFSSNINLVRLDLSDNAFTTISPNIFRNMTNLESINLHNNPLECCKIIDFFKWAARQTKLTDFQGHCQYLNLSRSLNKFNISICPIPVDGQWGSWTTTSCSVTCGNGIKHRNRTCNNPSPSDGGKLCQGVDNESLVCKLGDCSVDGHWGPWSSVTCSVTCGKGLGIRTRRCDNPPSSGDGNGFFGCDIEKKLCSLEKCRKSCNNAGKNSKSDGEWKKAGKSKMISNHRFMKNSMK